MTASELFMKAYLDLDQGIGEILRESITIAEPFRDIWTRNKINTLRGKICDRVQNPLTDWPEPIEIDPVVTVNGSKMLESTAKKHTWLVRTFEPAEDKVKVVDTDNDW